jgi:excinuclease ABC subunit A
MVASGTNSPRRRRKLEDKLKALLQQGFARILVDNQMIRLDEIDQHKLTKKDVMLIIDRIVVKAEEEFYNRLADAVQTAFYEGRYLSSTRIKTDKSFIRIILN